MIKKLLFFALILLCSNVSNAQMEIDGKIVYGNEWIDYSKKYWKLYVAEDAMYKMTVAELKAAGVPVSTTPLSKLQMFHLGKEYAFYRSTDGIGIAEDYILFYGKKNRSELDKHVHLEGVEVFNPEYSLITDEAAYFITVADKDISNTVSLTITNSSYITGAPFSYYLHEEKVVFSDRFYKPVLNKENVQLSTISNSEGFGTDLRKTTNFNLPVSNFVSNGVPGKLNVRLGGNRIKHKHEVYIDNKLVRTIREEGGVEENTRIFDESFNISPSLLTGDLDVKISSNPDSEFDKHRLALAKLTYPRAFNFQDVTFQQIVLPRSNASTYIEIDQWGDDNDVFAFVPSTGKMYASVIANGKRSIGLPAYSSEMNVILFSTTKSVDKQKALTFRDFSNVDHNFIILSHKRLMDNGKNYVQEYADYKSSEIGGGFNPIVVDIDELYDQFAYGVDRHFISVRNFSHFIAPIWSTAKYLFLMGHGLEYQFFRSKEDMNENEQFFLIPTFGKPGSDVLLTADVGDLIPTLVTGRIAVENVDDLRIYLDKIKEFDKSKQSPQTIEDKLWQKEIIHLSGGDKEDLRKRIFNYLSNMENVIKTNAIGADVFTFTKESSQGIEQSVSEQIFNRINEGVSILTFFGHSAVGSFDFNLDKVSNYQNKGKYPVLFSLGCHSGNINTNARYSISKEFVIQKDKGSIAFIAAAGISYDNDQYFFGRNFYSLLGDENFGKSIGEITSSTLEIMKNDERSGSQKQFLNAYIQQNIVHGDPSLILFSSDKPDVVCDELSAYTEPDVVDVYEEEFTYCVDIANLGYALDNERLEVKLEHVSPIGKSILDTIVSITLPKFKEQLCITLPIVSDDISGENRMLVTLNPNQKLEEGPNETAYQNNTLVVGGKEGFPFFVLSNSAIPTYPTEYGIVGNQKIELKASSFNAFAGMQNIILELDTTKLFDSPIKQSFTIQDVKGSFTKEVELMSTPEIVYYWRVSQDTTGSTAPPVWNTSSFVYVPKAGEGWNHSHYYQYLDDELEGVFFEEKNLRYKDDIVGLTFNNNDPLKTTQFFVNSSPWAPWRKYADGGIAIVIFDPIRGRPLRNNENKTGGLYGSIKKSGGYYHYFEYDTRLENGMNNLLKFLKEIVPDGFQVVVNFMSDKKAYPYMDWLNEIEEDGSFFNLLGKEGARELDNLDPSGKMAYVFGYIKGEDKRVLVEKKALTETSGVVVDFNAYKYGDYGYVNSNLIGPAKAYQNLEWSVDYSEMAETDTVSVDVIGIDNEGNETELYTNITDFDINFDLSQIDAVKYLRLKLRFNSRDEANKTTPQLTKLRVYYTPLPDISLVSGNISKKAYDAGESITFDYTLENASKTYMDAFSMDYSLISQNGAVVTQTQPIEAIPAGTKRTISTNLTPEVKSGTYQFKVEANSAKNPQEQYYFNNLGIEELRIQSDSLSPVIDVTFDGVTILDNDIVAAEPLIEIVVKDENKYLLMDDTSKFVLQLQYPNGQVKQISFSDERLRFYAAKDTQNNAARVELNPIFEEDGNYKLSIEARDRTNNVAGASTYEVNFRVFREEMISEVFNYPNPFSTSTQFIFTLTGDEEPSNIVIRIMTITGKVVREITSAELGSLKMGLNRTEYKWDGRDEYGDKLANGVYLYKVIAKKSDGSDYGTFNDSSASKVKDYFKDGFGKMVIMR